MIKRLIANIVLLLSIFFMPWWITLLLGVIFISIFPNFYEIFIMGILMDLLYSYPKELFFNFNQIFSLGVILIFVFIEKIKKYLRFYPSL
jgi:hypothetical protein